MRSFAALGGLFMLCVVAAGCQIHLASNDCGTGRCIEACPVRLGGGCGTAGCSDCAASTNSCGCNSSGTVAGSCNSGDCGNSCGRCSTGLQGRLANRMGGRTGDCGSSGCNDGCDSGCGSGSSGGIRGGGLLSGRSQFGSDSRGSCNEPVYRDSGFSLASGRGDGSGMVGFAGGNGFGGGCGQFGCGNGGRLCLGCRLKNAFGGGRNNGYNNGHLRGAVSGMGIHGQHPYGGQIPHTDYTGISPQGGMTPTVAYPYYTTRGPRDFLMKNPPSIGW